MASKKIVLVEVTQIEHTFPLAASYVHNYAKAHAASAADWDFAIRPYFVNTPTAHLVDELVKERADVYAFSCYCWNMRRIRAVLAALRDALPEASFLLGGPQVLGSAHLYLEPGQENVFFCNGEGEPTVRAFLDEYLAPRPDWSNVPTLSFQRDGELCTTAVAPQVDLDSIPSPFLNSPFPSDTIFTQFLWETNRGCPFHCTFCTWGQLQDTIAKFDIDRLKAEIEWMAKRQYMSLHVCDANFGMLERDLELAEHLAKCKRDYGVPFIVIASHIKNKPRVIEIADVFRGAGINANTTSALQSVNQDTLVTIKRKNGSTAQFMAYQRALGERGLGSYAEVIWPLPDETLESFVAGMVDLAKLRIGSVMAYPLMLLNNTEMSARRAEHGFTTIWERSDTKEIEWVVATKDVDERACLDGFWFYVSFLMLYNTRSLYYTLHYLHEQHGVPYAEVLGKFADTLKTDKGELGEYCREVVVERNPAMDGATYGILVAHAWHTHRESFSVFLLEFCKKRAWWSDPLVRTLVELELHARPFPFNNPNLFRAPACATEGLLVSSDGMRFVLSVPDALFAWLAKNVEVGELPARSSGYISLAHAREQLPNVARRSIEQGAYYMQTLLENIRSVTPRITACDARGRPLSVERAPESALVADTPTG